MKRIERNLAAQAAFEQTVRQLAVGEMTAHCLNLIKRLGGRVVAIDTERHRGELLAFVVDSEPGVFQTISTADDLLQRVYHLETVDGHDILSLVIHGPASLPRAA